MSQDLKMSLVEHLDEMRSRIIYSIIAVALIAGGAYVFRDFLLEILTRPITVTTSPNLTQGDIPGLIQSMREFLEGTGSEYFTEHQIEGFLDAFKMLLKQRSGLMFIHPTEAFFTYIKLAILTGIIVGAPFILYEVWRFVLPALYEHEKRYFFSSFTFGTFLFYIGAGFSFLVVLPLAIKFLIGVAGSQLQANFTISNYVSFVMLFMLAFGLAFEMPVLAFLASRMGLVTSSFLREKRKYMIVLIFIAAAILTPPDPFTQMSLAIPLLLLYELSIWIAKVGERKSEPQAEQ